MRKLIASYRRTLARYHHPDRGVRVRARGAQGGRRRQRRDAGAGSSSWSAATKDDPLFLQAKEAQPSVLERFVGASEHANHGQRVVVGQRLMQAASDIFLGWVRVKDLDGRTRDYYIRQLHDWKGGVEVESFRVPGATALRRACAGRPSRARTRAGATGSRSPRTSARATRSTARSRTSPSPTPTRTSATTRRSPQPSSRAGSRPGPACRADYWAGPEIGRIVALRTFPYWSSQVTR